MKSFKLTIAVLIVALGQGNIFAGNRAFLLQKFKTHDSKIIVAAEADKQRVSRLPSQKRLNLRKNLLVQKPAMEKLVAADFIDDLAGDFRLNHKPEENWKIWFGCCGA